MNRPNSPTVRQLLPVKRVLAGAAIAGAVAAAAPAMASADVLSTCTYEPSFHRVTITDKSQASELRLTRVGNGIAIGAPNETPALCGNGITFATVENTDKIFVNTPGTTVFSDADAVVVDMSNGPFAPGFIAENDGNSEIEVLVRTTGTLTSGLTVVGTPQADAIRLAERSSVLIGPDNDVDISMTTASNLTPVDASPWRVNGGGGNDFVSARGAFPAAKPRAVTHRVVINGGEGSDNLTDGLSGSDFLNGNNGNDALFAQDTHDGDSVTGGSGTDVATLDAQDNFASDVEQNTGGVLVGKLKLAPAIVRAKPGKAVRMTMSWTHPKAWKALRAIAWRVSDGADPVGSLVVKPRSARVVAHGIKLLRGTVSHKGKTVTAKLALRVPKALAGHQLRVDVQATDSTGRTQLAPSAGLIRVGR